MDLFLLLSGEGLATSHQLVVNCLTRPGDFCLSPKLPTAAAVASRRHPESCTSHANGLFRENSFHLAGEAQSWCHGEFKIRNKNFRCKYIFVKCAADQIFFVVKAV
jgi:hypothetical protein